MGDRYFKLAYEYYGDSKLWWVIAWYNQKPSEADVKNGDTIFIPLPLDKVLSALRVWEDDNKRNSEAIPWVKKDLLVNLSATLEKK